MRIFLILFTFALISFGEAPKRVLVILSSATEIELKNNTKHPTGHFLGELAEPLKAMLEKGYEIDFTSPNGTPLALDKDSFRKIYWLLNSKGKEEAIKLLDSRQDLKKPKKLESITDEDLNNYSGIFIPGGHAPMVDLAKNKDVARILKKFHNEKKPIGMICHAPVALLSLRDIKPWPFEGYKLTVFGKTEEKFAEKLFLHGKVPYYPDEELEKLGARVKNGLPNTSNVVRDRELVTGQNPYSPREFGEVFVKVLNDFTSRSSTSPPNDGTH